MIKRISALSDAGWRVTGFTFHRVRDKVDRPPAWENIHLGTTYNRRYLQRLAALGGALVVLWKERRRLAECQAVYAVNTDNALLALLACRIAGCAAPVVLELADVQPVMVGKGLISRMLRALERWVLGKTKLLVTTSPGFVREYFEPVQQYRGEIFLLENKVYPASAIPPLETTSAEPVEGGSPWVIGYFGAFRCRRSIEWMRSLAARLGPRVRFVLRGYPAGTIADGFAELLGNLPNIEFGGPYEYPSELAAIYRNVDLNWVFDESDPAGNSAWLLPNRIYEGGCFAVPAIGAADTETGRWIEGHGLGWTFSEPLESTLAEFFETLDPEEWQKVKSRCAATPRERFCGDADYAELSRILREMRP